MESGGSERQTLNLLRGIDRSAFAPELYLLYREGILLGDLPPDVAVTDYWSRHAQPQWNWPGRITSKQIHDLEQTLVSNKVDVVYDRLFHMALVAGPAAKRAGVGRVATIVSPPRRDLMATERRFVWLKRMALARSYRSADRLLAVSQGTADDAADFYRLDRSKIEIVSSPIDIERIDRLKRDTWDGTAPRVNRFLIVSIGRLSEEKGHRCLLEAFAKLLQNSPHPIDLHLIGDGPLRLELKQQASVLGIRENVVFHGQVANPFPLLRQADLFVLPSQYEGLPNALLEAMACEVPTLVSDCPGGIQDATQRGDLSRLVPIGEPIALCKAIRDRFDSPESWLSKTGPARKYIEQSHSLGQWLKRMESIFMQVGAKSRTLRDQLL